MRNIYRHASELGSVIEFDMYGKQTKIFVPDAAYRPTEHTVFGSVEVKMRGFEPKSSGGSSICSGMQHVFIQLTEELPVVSDKELQERFPEFEYDKTGAENTDMVCSAITDEASLDLRVGMPSRIAARLAREVTFFGCKCCLPNIYELMVIWLESDRLDAMDPTAADHPEYALHRFYRSLADFEVCSSTFIESQQSPLMIGFTGVIQRGLMPGRKYTEDGYPFDIHRIIPIIERVHDNH